MVHQLPQAIFHFHKTAHCRLEGVGLGGGGLFCKIHHRDYHVRVIFLQAKFFYHVPCIMGILIVLEFKMPHCYTIHVSIAMLKVSWPGSRGKHRVRAAE